MSDAQSALNRTTGGALNAQAIRMMRELGPLAARAVDSISDAVARRLTEKRALEARLEEESRLAVAASQSFYADECATTSTTTGSPAASTARPPATSTTAGTRATSVTAGSLAISITAGARVTSPTAGSPTTSITAGSPATSAGPAIPDSLSNLASKASEWFQRAGYNNAEALLQQAYELYKKQYGANHPDTLRALNKLAAVQLAVNNYKSAIVSATAAFDPRERLFRSITRTTPPQHDEIAAGLAVGESISTRATIYRASGAYQEAKQDYEHAVELRIRYLGADHLCVAESQNGFGELLLLMGNYPAARRLFEAALTIREHKLGLQHRDTARTINNLASLYRSIGDLSRARELYQRALGIRQKMGNYDVDVAASHNDIGDLYKLSGDYVKAESEYDQALDIRRNKLGEGLETAQSENALAGLYQTMGDYGRAQEFYKIACDIRQKKLGADHPDTAESLSDLGNAHLALGDYAKAESEYKQALDIRRNKLGADHPFVANSLVALGNVHRVLGNYTMAESELSQALDIRQNKLGADHPFVAESQHWLGVLHQAMGDHAAAEPFYLNALSLREKKLGADHPDVAESLTHLSTLMIATGRSTQALEYLHRAFNISEQLLRGAGMASTESRMDALLRILRTQEEIAYSLLLEKSVPANAATFAMSVALLRKGRSLDEAAGASRAVYQNLDDAERQNLQELKALRAQIVNLTLGGTSDAAEVKSTTDRADKLERELAQHSAPLRAKDIVARPDEIVVRVAQVLPADGVLVEIVAFCPYLFHARGQASPRDKLRYLALVLRHDASVQVVPLGPSEPIHRLIDAFRAALVIGPQTARDIENSYPMLRSAEALYQSIFQPVRARFAEADKNIFLSLDSQLHLVPFAALFDGKKYLVETYQFTYLTSGRDLLRADLAQQHSTTVEVIANPDFIKGAHGGPASRPATTSRTMTEVPDALNLPKATVHSIFNVGSLGPLPGAFQEAQAIQNLLPNARLVSGSKATKEAFLSVRSPGILHVATHGFFRDRTGHAVAGESANAEISKAPLLSSMLMLAGSGVKSDDGKVVNVQPEGVATALEVTGMNLWGTQLVVLSACETGIGDVSNLGQGVYGLRRAVMVAGAETLVTSLWPVDDQTTHDLMVQYYQNLLAGKGRVEAMRASAEWMRKRRKHPYYWAPFIVIGSSDPLVGIGKKSFKQERP